ncbi:MAG TPA: acyl-CoA desaturase [Acidimicrobiales bacterium]|jgi:fatty acid desaturase
MERPAAADYRTLSMQVREAGLLDRRLPYYGAKIGLTLAAFAAGWIGFFLLGPSWATLGIAAFLGLVSTQLGFIGHDAGHGQIFATRRMNRLTGLVIGNGLIGLSFGWWVPKHSSHHAHPNQVDRDPDIGVGLFPAADDLENQPSPLARWLSRRQAELFLPLMLLRSTGLYVSGVQHLLRRRNRAAVVEGILLALRTALYLSAVLWVLPLPEALCFILVNEAVFSVYLGCSFAPNHKGMELIDTDSTMSFARRQVVTARNISGGRFTAFIFGGLNYQIEHHLFSTMPRPNLRRAQALVRPFCAENRFGYSEASPIGSYRQIFSSLRPTSSPIGLVAPKARTSVT